MTDTKDTDNTRRPPLSVGSKSGAGVVKQSFSHGRSNTVIVEVKRRRILGRPGETEAPADIIAIYCFI